MENEWIIRALNISKSFEDIPAIRDFTIEIRKGELFGLIGPDGAGKTTIIRILCGILTPTSGNAYVAGFSILKDAETIKERIGYMPQRFGLYEDLNVVENMEFYADIYDVPKNQRMDRIEVLLHFAGLLPFKRRLAGHLSGGMKQKLGLACALLHRPQILFLDEPTCGVDPLSRRELWTILSNLAKDGITVFLSTPYLDEAERCTRIGLMDKGRLLLVEEPEAMKDFMRLPVLEITSRDLRSLMDLIAKVEGVKHINLYGDRLHITFVHMDNLYSAKEAIEKSSFEIESMRFIKPSLEDIFIFVAGS